MNRPLARRAGPFLAASAGCCSAASSTPPRWPARPAPGRRSGHLHRVVFTEKWEEIRREPLLGELKQRIRDVRQGPDGLLYALTSENPGAVLRIEPVEATTTR